MYTQCIQYLQKLYNFSKYTLRPGKLDLLFLISHLLVLHVSKCIQESKNIRNEEVYKQGRDDIKVKVNNLVVGRMLQHSDIHSLHRTFESTVLVLNQ